MRLLLLLEFTSVLAFGQLIPQTPVTATRILNITSATIIDCGTIPAYDNRSQFQRQDDSFSYSATGSGSWSVTLQYSDSSCSGPWTSFGSTGVVTQASGSPIGFGYGYHPFVSFAITGSPIVSFSAWKQFYIPSGASSVSFPITIPQGGTSASNAIDAKTNLGIPYLNPGDFNFTPQTQSGSLISGGVGQVINFSPCPKGVNGTDLNHKYVLTNPTEYATGLGGTCTSGANSGTIIISAPSSNHTGGAYTAGPTTGGIAEASYYAGNYGIILLPPGTITIFTPIFLQYHVSIVGAGRDVSFIQNSGTNTSAIQFISAIVNSNDPLITGGSMLTGFTVYAGGIKNTSATTNTADGIYLQDANWNYVVRDVEVRNHNRGIHAVNGWEWNFENISMHYINQDGIRLETDGSVGTGAGGGAHFRNVRLDQVGLTGGQSSSSCGVNIATWSGIYMYDVQVTLFHSGLCLVPRAPHGAESSTQDYYGWVTDSAFDTCLDNGLLIDGTLGPVEDIEFNNDTFAFTGCTPGTDCVNNPFPNPGKGIWIKGTNGGEKDIRFVGGTARENGGPGAQVDNGQFISFGNFTWMANGQAASNTYDGLYVANQVTDLSVQNSPAIGTGVSSILLTRLPRYGINVQAGGIQTNFRITGNRFGPQNVSGNFVGPTIGSHVIQSNFPLNDQSINQTTFSTFFANIPAGVSANVASAATVTPTGALFHMTGAAAITTMNLPTNFISGWVCAIADGAWSISGAGNVVPAVTATANRTYCFYWDPGPGKWYMTGQ